MHGKLYQVTAAARRVLPILPAPAHAGSRQDVRSTARTPGPQLPEPRITGTRPGSDRPRCRRSTPGAPQPVPAAASIRGPREARSSPEGAADPPGPARAGSSPERAQRGQGAPCTAAGAQDHGHRCRYSHLYYGNQSTPPEAREGPQKQRKPRTCFYIPHPPERARRDREKSCFIPLRHRCRSPRSEAPRHKARRPDKRTAIKPIKPNH